MRKSIKDIQKYVNYYKRYGINGVNLLLNVKRQNKNILTFNHLKFKQPIYLRNNTSDWPVFEQVFWDDQYYMNYNFEPKVIVDCGANIGLTTKYFKEKYPKAKIISIEPEQSNYDLLLKNTEAYDDIFCLKGGIWNKSTNLIIKNPTVEKWGIMIEESISSTEDSIKAYTISDIIEKYNLDQIDILKIDIEGSEKELFELNFEKWLPKVRVLIVELHEGMREGATKSFFKALSNYDFSITSNGENLYVFMK